MDEPEARKYNIKSSGWDGSARTAAQKNYFFLDQKLYKMLRQHRASDLLVAWDFEENKIVHFILSDAKKKMQNAYDSSEAARLLNRRREVLQDHILKGAINPPIQVNFKGRNIKGHKFGTMKWSEADILAMHSHLLTVGSGRPRRDGRISPGPRLPTRRELIAMMRSQPLFYMKTSSGEFVPVWSANNEV